MENGGTMHTSRGHLLTCVGLLLLLFSTTACDLNWNPRKLNARQRHKLDVPLGWKLVRGRAQMLARSYPRDRWVSLMLRFEGKPRRLFSVQPVKLPSVMDVIRLFQGNDSMNPMGQTKRRRARKKVRLYGISFLFRNAETLPMQVRMIQSQGKGKNARVRIFTQALKLKPTIGRWTRKIFWFRDFRLQGKPDSKHRAKALASSRLEFWEKTPAGWKTDSRSVTIVGPTLWTTKPPASASSQPTTRQAATRATSRPARRSGVRKPQKRVPTTRPSARKTR
jgi:hypothetical protein